MGAHSRDGIRGPRRLIAVDTNLLIYAHRGDSPFHEVAADCIRNLAQSRSPWAIAWPCLYEFIAVATHPRIYQPPTPVAAALEQIEIWMSSPSLALLTESATHWSELKSLVLAGRIAGPQIHDARIAAICLNHGVRELWTADRDFGRFPQLRVANPLIT